MSEAPKRIWAWRFNPTWQGGYWREDKNAAQPEKSGAEYVRADLIEEQAALLREAGELLADSKRIWSGIVGDCQDQEQADEEEAWESRLDALLAKLEARNA